MSFGENEALRVISLVKCFDLWYILDEKLSRGDTMKIGKRLISGLTAAAMLFGIAVGPIDESGILSKLFDRGITASAESLSSCFPTPYKTVAFKVNSTGRYLTCDVGAKKSDGKYNMNGSTIKAEATKAQAYEMFELIPLSKDGPYSGCYAIRSAFNRKYLSYHHLSVDQVKFKADFINEDEVIRLDRDGTGCRIQFLDEDRYLRVKDDHSVDTTKIMGEATWFQLETISNNAYTAKEMAVLSDKMLYNGENNPSYWKIQSEIGNGQVTALESMGYTPMYRKDMKASYPNTVVIDNMECAIGVKQLDDGSYDVLITFQGTGGYGTDGVLDQRDNITNTLGATVVNDKQMHQGYCDMAHKLYSTDTLNGNNGIPYQNIIQAEVGPNKTVKTLSDLIAEARIENAHFTLLGHSMGGAIAQCYALYLIDDCGVNTEYIKGRTFNSALAISFDKDWDKFDWYNICVATDTVPNGLVPGSIYEYGLHRLGKTIWLYDDTPDLGTDTYVHIGTYSLENISAEKHEIQNKLRDRLQYIKNNLEKRHSSSGGNSGGSEPEKPVFDENYFVDQMFKYKIEDDHAVITGYIGEDTSVSIPSEIKGYKVEVIDDNAFWGCESLTSITIPDSVSYIGESAFSVCTNLTSLMIPNGVVSIGDYAFNNCDSLSGIVIPEGVKKIGERVFNGCLSLSSITIPNGVTSIGDYAFSECTSLTSITIPNSVSSIGEGAFLLCESLENITIPNSVTSISDSVFFCCTGVTSITIPDSVTSIGDGAFGNCESLTSITVPDSVVSIGTYAFEGCTNLTSILVDKQNNEYSSLDGVLFNKDQTILVICPSGKSSSYVIPDSVTYIDNRAFCHYSSLTSITIPDSVMNIGDEAFWGCENLTSITIPNSVTSIGHYAFTDCTNLTSIAIPSSVTSIGYQAFGYANFNMIDSFTIYGCTGTAAEEYSSINHFTFIPLDGTSAPVTLDITLKANDKTMSSESVSISVDGAEASTSENGKAELTLADGTHEITFSAHGFVPRTYTVEVMDGQLTEELTPELNLYGDTDGNGVVNTLDVVKLKRHLINIEPLTGYALDCANTDGNDTINTLDVVKLKRHLINIEPLW